MIINTRSVSPGYFSTLGISLIKGRDFSDRDKSEAPAVAIVNQDLVRTYFPNEDPIGKRITFTDGESWMSIVGVIGDVKQLGLGSTCETRSLLSVSQVASPSMSLVVRTTTSPLSQVAAVKGQIQR